MKFGYKLKGHHMGIIREVVIATGCETYLELGVFDGTNIHEMTGYCPRCVGVDNRDQRYYKDFEFYNMTTDKFFDTIPIHADIIFIDADHDFKFVKKDFENSLKVLNKWGLIFLHDTDPIEKGYLQSGICGDAYKIKDWIRDNHPGLDILTLPVSAVGLTIVNRNENRLQ